MGYAEGREERMFHEPITRQNFILPSRADIRCSDALIPLSLLRESLDDVPLRVRGKVAEGRRGIGEIYEVRGMGMFREPNR